MRILFTIDLFPNIDGTSIFIQRLAESFNKFGHSCVILTSDIPTDLTIKSTKNFKVIRIHNQAFDFFLNRIFKRYSNKVLNRIKSVINKIEYKIISYLREKTAKYTSLSLLWDLFRDPFGWKLLLKILMLKTKNFDMILTTPIGRSCVSASLIAAKLKKIPISIKPAYHYMIEHYYNHDRQFANILKKFNLVFPSTIAELEYLSKIGIPKNIMRVIGYGIPFKEINTAGGGNWREKLQIPEEKFVVLYINTSVDEYYKGINEVIKSAIKLPSIHFIFVGKNEMRWKKLQEKFNLHNLKNITYIETVFGEEKYQLFNAIDIVARPSINDAFGLVYFESMSAGKPIITSDIDSMIEVSKDVGISIPFGDVDVLIKAISQLKEDKILYQKLSKNALIKGKNNSWKNISKKYETALNHLIENI